MAKILDLDKLFNRKIVRIEGKSYELRTNEELAPLTVNQLAAKAARIQALQYQQPLSPDDETELKRLPRELCDAVLIAPPDVIQALNGDQHWAVCQSFLFQRSPDLIGLQMSDQTGAPGATSTGAS